MTEESTTQYDACATGSSASPFSGFNLMLAATVREESPIQLPLVDPPAGAFPLPEDPAASPGSSAREAIIIDPEHYYPLQYSQFSEASLRTPEQAYDLSNSRNSVSQWVPKKSVDTFRHITGRQFFLSNGATRTLVEGAQASTATGMPFEYEALGVEALPEDGRYVTRTKLTFDMDALGHLLGPRGATGLSTRATRLELEDFVYGTGGTSDQPQYPHMIGGYADEMFKDFTFSAPAAYSYSELSGLSTPIQDRVEVRAFSTQARPDTSKTVFDLGTSIYREYKKTLQNLEELENQSPLAPPPEYDEVQKFPADQVLELLEINQMASGDQESSYYSQAQESLNSGHVKIKFSMHHASPIAEAFKRREMDTFLLELMSDVPLNGTKTFMQIIDQAPFVPFVSPYASLFPSVQSATTRASATRSLLSESRAGLNDRALKYYKPAVASILPHLEHAVADPLSIAGLATPRMIQMSSEEYPLSHPSVSLEGAGRMIASSNLELLKADLEAHLSDKKRTFKKIMDGEKCYSEVVAYRLEKRDAETNNIIQNFYFFNARDPESPRTESFEFLDTQVNHGLKYKYRIYAINFVVGCNYKYNKIRSIRSGRNPNRRSRGRPHCDLDVESNDVYLLMETPYYEEDIYVGDSPPLFPEAEIKPVAFYDLRRSGLEYILPNEFNIQFTPRGGETFEVPMAILPSDSEKIDEMIAREPRNFENKITYRSDNPPEGYQIIMIENHPAGYEDFSSPDAVVISTPGVASNIHCQPNKNYYMIFRAFDNSGISNPSEVYRVKINQRAEGNSLEYSVESFNSFVDDTRMTFRDSLSIEAAQRQWSVNYSNLEQEFLRSAEFWQSAPSISELSLGTHEEEDLIWDKKFKFRLKSKHTGKAVDLNVKFKEKKIIYEEHRENQGVYIPSMRASERELPNPGSYGITAENFQDIVGLSAENAFQDIDSEASFFDGQIEGASAFGLVNEEPGASPPEYGMPQNPFGVSGYSDQDLTPQGAIQPVSTPPNPFGVPTGPRQPSWPTGASQTPGMPNAPTAPEPDLPTSDAGPPSRPGRSRRRRRQREPQQGTGGSGVATHTGSRWTPMTSGVSQQSAPPQVQLAAMQRVNEQNNNNASSATPGESGTPWWDRRY